MSKCPKCGGELNFSVESQSVVCPFCRNMFNPKELNIKAKVASERKKIEIEPDGNHFEGKSYNCSQCGATLLTFDETAITFCSYCGSQSMIESKMIVQNNPDFIIPFKMTREECINNYKKLLKKAHFIPKYMQDDLVVDKFRGIFMPYCIYKTTYKGELSNNGSKYSHRSGDYDIYDDYEILADVDATYDGMSYDLLSKFYDCYSNAIPFDFNKKEDFNTNFLIGFYADTMDVDKTIYDKIAENISSNDSKRFLYARKEYRKYGCKNPMIRLSVSDRKIGMFPVYFLAIRTKDNKHVHYAVINGQTGKIAADLPIDFKKYIILTLILSVIIFLLINMYLYLLPNIVLWLSLLASIVSLVVSRVQAKKINNKENKLDDMGYKYVNKNVEKNKLSIKYSIKQFISLLICAFILIINPYNDEYYYIGSIVTLGLIILSFYDLVKEHNDLTSNKLPQLEKRGGDEREK